MSLRERDVLVGGVRSRVREGGPIEAEEAVVFVHGACGSSEDWSEVMGRVSSFMRVVALDLPGFGQADRPRRFDYSPSGYVRHLSGVLEQLGVERAHLVLHDFGTPIGLSWAIAKPAAVRSVTLMGSGILEDFRGHAAARALRTPILGWMAAFAPSRSMYRRMLTRGNPKPLPATFVDRMVGQLDWGTKRAMYRLYQATADARAMHRGLAEHITPLRVPALVVWGTADPFLPASHAERQRRYFGDTEVHLLSGAGHWPFIDEPEEAARLVVAFLGRQRSAATRAHA